MMKYIRAKEGIYEVVTTERGSDNKLLYIISTSKTDTSTDWIHEGDVIAPADTIEELCDEFRYKADNVDHIRCWKSTRTRIWRSFGDNIMLNKQEIKTIRGAIWTSKGLIYVAKVNDKGELELI